MLTNPAIAITMLGRMDISKILVPIRGNHVDAEVIKMACSLAEDNGASIYAVYVIEVERSLPIDASLDDQSTKAEEVLSRAETFAREYGYEIDTGLLQAREAGPAIVGEAVEGGADVIVMGVGYRRRLGTFDIGYTTSHVLKEAPCHVVLYRAASIPGEKA